MYYFTARIKEYLEKHRFNRKVRYVLTTLAAVVIFITTYLLVYPALTLEKDAICGIEEHEHTASCYASELVCGLEESEGHEHTDECYQTDLVTVCPLEEHEHSEECFDENGNVTCELEEHTHTDECFEEVSTLICGQEEYEGHQHTDSCYKEVLSCGKEMHVHGVECYAETEAEIDTAARMAEAESERDAAPRMADADETAGNGEETEQGKTTGAAEALKEDSEDALEEASQVSTEAQKETSGEVSEDVSESDASAPLPEITFSDTLTELTSLWYQNEDDTWTFISKDTPFAPEKYIQVHLAYNIPQGSLDSGNAMITYELPESLLISDEDAEMANKDENYLNQLITGSRLPKQTTETEENISENVSENTEKEYLAGKYVLNKNENDKWQLVITFNDYSIEMNNTQDITGWMMFYMKGSELEIDENGCGKTVFAEKTDNHEELSAEYIVNTDEVEGVNNENVVDESDAVGAEETVEVTETESETEETTDTEIVETEENVEEDNNLMQYPAQTFTGSTEYVNVKVLAEEGTFPAGTTMTVKDVEDAGTVDTIIESVEGSSDGSSKKVEKVNAVDITFYDEDGNIIEPAKNVCVVMEPVQKEEKAGDDAQQGEAVVVHVDDEGKANILEQNTIEEVQVDIEGNQELKEAAEETAEDAVVFEADSFSVYAIVYTVDFHYEINGKMYDFSIPGGGFVSFEHVVEVLGIASADESAENGAENAETGTENKGEFVGKVPSEDEDGENGTNYEQAIKLNEIEVSEATSKFVADVESVEFSNPELVWVGKVYEATTVGGLKEANGLEVEYSAELTEEQNAEINAQTVEDGDWALISVQPFTSEETLTVTMKNGNQFVVRVTDGQNVTEVRDIDADGFYVIYVDQYSNNTHHYYALRNDGASIAVPNNDLDALGAEYVWQFGYDDTACWWYNGSKYVEPEWSIVVGDNPDGRYLWIEKRGSGFGIHGNYWSDNYLSWDSSQGFKVVNTGFDVPIKVYERDKPRLNFSVAVNNPSYGSVSCSNTVTDLNWKNTAPIVATPADDCYFVGWRRGDEVLTGYSSTIPVGGIDITADNQVLTAIFGKNYTSPATQEINEWVDSLLGNPLESDKTAHVHDYDNRIYEIDLSASSSRYTIDQDIRIEFITDISRSMYFPETLMNEQDFRVNGQINLGQWLLNNGDPNQVYYVIGDINNTATMYAVYFSGNNYFTRWSIVDASYYLPYDNASTSGRIKTVCEISNGRTTIYMTDRFDGNANRIFTGKIYNSTPKPPKDTADWDRLSYLTAAVNAVSRAIYRLDPGAEIGLVTFASSASGGTLYGAEDEASLISALQSIQPVGGTNQTSAFNLINNSNPPVFSLNSGKRQVALLITDGAPQGTTWDAIERAAGVTEGKDVEIWTLGLALDRVGNNKQRLMDLASDGGYSGNAEDPDQLVTETKKILQEMLVKATVIGEVYDTVDPAFYPVDSSGNPIEEGFYYADTAGGSVTCHSAAPSDVKKSYYHWVNDNGTWSIAYYNQEIKWPEDGGWKESFYVKAKEDFMGGNAISTNSGVDNRVEANRVKHSGSPEGYYWLNQDHSSFRVDYETPYVNVDELSMTENSTEWTVYLGTEVDPEEELKELWDKIRVNLVVKKNGINGDAYTVTGGSQMYYSDDLLNDAGSPDGTSNESLPLSHFVNGDLIETLLRQIKNGETTASSNLIYRYFPYGHSIIGTFELSLEKTVNQAAAEDDAPKQHETKEKGQEKEVYTLKVTYTPVGDNASTSYAHTTSGKSAGKVADGYDGTTGNKIDSENVHKIHVFAKDLEIQKKDMTNTSKLIDTAKFKLYRTAKKVIDPDTGMETSEFESDAEDLKVGNETKKVVQIGDELTTSGGKITVNNLSYAPDGTYYLVETKAPDGYIMATEPIEMHLYLDDAYTHYLAPHETITKAQTVNNPYNWTQTLNRLGYDSSKTAVVDDTKIIIEVLNNPGVKLPSTGGPGTRVFTVLGSILILGAGVLLWRRRRLI